MHADSLLQGLRRIDDEGTQLLALRTFSGPEPALRIDKTMATLGDVAELLRAGAPFPPHYEGAPAGDGHRYGDSHEQSAFRLDGGSQEPVDGETGADSDVGAALASESESESEPGSDELVTRVLEASYQRGGAMIERFDPSIADRAVAAERLETVGSWVLVPLSGTGPYARNWPPVIEVLLKRIETLLEDFRRISRRARTAATDRPIAAGCEGIVEMLETLSLVVQRADADTRYVRDRADHRQGELLSTIEQATSQLRSDDNA